MRETRDYCDIDEIAAQSAQAGKGQILVGAGELRMRRRPQSGSPQASGSLSLPPLRSIGLAQRDRQITGPQRSGQPPQNFARADFTLPTRREGPLLAHPARSACVRFLTLSACLKRHLERVLRVRREPMDGSFCLTAPGASRRTATAVPLAQGCDLRGENCGGDQHPLAQCRRRRRSAQSRPSRFLRRRSFDILIVEGTKRLWNQIHNG